MKKNIMESLKIMFSILIYNISQGTGLGYDIVKAHGGDLTMETKEGEGTEFIIQLPI